MTTFDDDTTIVVRELSIIDSPTGPIQTSAFGIDDGVIRALYVVRNSDKLRHVPPAP
jgi:hypothetical protein